MVQFAILTGVRISEIVAIKWADIYTDAIHIHRMQCEREGQKGTNRYFMVEWTKNEIHTPINQRKGRLFPRYCSELDSLIDDIHNLQIRFNVSSEYLFAKQDGSNVDIKDYKEALRKICKSLGFSIKNNHAFRKALNMRLINDYNIDVAKRAKMLGHSVKTNLTNYTTTDEDWIARTVAKKQVTNGDQAIVVFFKNKKEAEAL